MDCSMPGFLVLHCFLKFAQIHVHWVSDAIQPSHSHLILPFSSCPQSFPVSGSFPMSWLIKSGGQSIVTSASASVLPVNTQAWCLLWLTGLISISIYLPSYLSIFPYVTWKSISIYYLVLYQKMFANPDLGFLSALSTWPTHLPGGSDIPLPRYC